MKNIRAHFKKADPVLHAAIAGNDGWELRRPHNHFTGLCRIVIGQQVSTAAATSIFKKFRSLFPGKKPSVTRALQLTVVELRSAGLSASKAAAILDLAQRIADASLQLMLLQKLEDHEVISKLVAVKGIGPWSAEMFLIFYLGREDVFSPGDLGLRTAIMKLYGKRKLPSPEEAARLAVKWSPYRSYACRILWQSLNNTP